MKVPLVEVKGWMLSLLSVYTCSVCHVWLVGTVFHVLVVGCK